MGQGWLFSPGLFIRVLDVLDRENHKITPIDAEKACDKIQHPFMIKTPIKVGIVGTYVNVIKAIYNKFTTNIILNVKS